MGIFDVGSAYTFSTIAPQILGARVDNAKIQAILTYDAASLFVSRLNREPQLAVYANANLEQLHQAILPLLPSGTPTVLRAYSFILYTKEGGAQGIVALEWLDQASIQRVQAIEITAIVRNVTIEDVIKIRQLLNSAGYNAIDITVNATTQ